MKKLHIKRIKLEFDNDNSMSLDIDKIIKEEKELLKRQNPKMNVYEFKEMYQITNEYLILTFKINEIKKGMTVKYS